MTEVKSKEWGLDVRTKFLLLITISFTMLQASYTGWGVVLMIYLIGVPCVMLLLYKRTGMALKYMVSIVIASIISLGSVGPIIMGICGVFTRLLPVGIVGYIFIQTTKVNEVSHVMDRMKVPRALSIPVAVLFRFFPTLSEEYGSISNAMKMRGIRFGGKHPGKMIEYRMIPILMSSIRIGDELSAAALTRGLGKDTERTSITEIRFNICDILTIGICVCMTILYVILEFNII